MWSQGLVVGGVPDVESRVCGVLPIVEPRV